MMRPAWEIWSDGGTPYASFHRKTLQLEAVLNFTLQARCKNVSDMMTFRGAITMLHGMLFGAFFLFAAFALVIELARLWHPHNGAVVSAKGRRMEGLYLTVTSAFGWLAVLTGTYLVYPWYRAAAPAAADLHGYPRSLLLASASTAPLHSIGMEWKEHVAFIAPIVFTGLAWILVRYPQESRQQSLRRVLLVFGVVAFLSAAIPGFIGALLNKAAPTDGPGNALTVQLGAKHGTR